MKIALDNLRVIAYIPPISRSAMEMGWTQSAPNGSAR